MSFLREETKKRGFSTADGVHMGPCEIHKAHAHTIGPDGSLFACPGFAGEALQSTGHIDGRQEDYRTQARRNFERLAAWEECNDCAFIPVCAGGCTVAAHTELGDMHAPNCHKTEFRSRRHRARARRARRAASCAAAGNSPPSARSTVSSPRQTRSIAMTKNKKTQNPKKNGTLRPWLVDVVVDNLR